MSAVISCYNEYYFLKSNFIKYKSTILTTSEAVTALNKNKNLTVSFLKKPLHVVGCLSDFNLG